MFTNSYIQMSHRFLMIGLIAESTMKLLGDIGSKIFWDPIFEMKVVKFCSVHSGGNPLTNFYDMLMIDVINRLLLNKIVNLESFLVNKFTLSIMMLIMSSIFYLLRFLYYYHYTLSERFKKVYQCISSDLLFLLCIYYQLNKN